MRKIKCLNGGIQGDLHYCLDRRLKDGLHEVVSSVLLLNFTNAHCNMLGVNKRLF